VQCETVEQYNNLTILDFTIKTYRQLLESLKALPHPFQTFAEFLEKPEARGIILRHDVEARYGNALLFAQIQHEFGISGTYYFRFLPDHFDDGIISEIASLGHEIGYHYDDLSHCKGDYDAAIKRFEKNLATLREIAEVKTICMEGAPLSKYDNRDLWKQGNKGTRRQEDRETRGRGEPQAESYKPHYRDYGIIGEPYFDIDFSRMLYLTDTGRRWDGGKVSVRDKVVSRQSSVVSQRSAIDGRKSAISNQQSEIITQNSKLKTQNFSFHSTSDIIAAANSGLLPDQIMLTFHPQRWTDKPFPWLQELVLQNIKNVVKRMIVKSDKVVKVVR
jgi:hypothetical protein